MLRDILCRFTHLLIFPLLLFGQGASVSVQRTDYSVVSGELISVRESGVVISTIEGVQEKEFPAHPSSILFIQNEQIISLTIIGISNVLRGAGEGLLIGAGTGMLIGLASGDDAPGILSFSATEKGGIGAIFLGGIGLIIGTIGGIASSPPDRAI